jgi:hypothetical protein
VACPAPVDTIQLSRSIMSRASVSELIPPIGTGYTAYRDRLYRLLTRLYLITRLHLIHIFQKITLLSKMHPNYTRNFSLSKNIAFFSLFLRITFFIGALLYETVSLIFSLTSSYT